MTDKSASDKSTFVIGGISSPLDSFVVAESFVISINICGAITSLAKPQNVIGNQNKPPI
jgi:hypothetical protein